MSFFKKLFSSVDKVDNELKDIELNLALDDLFVHHFSKKNGKFLYCLSEAEVLDNLKNILKENDWNQLTLLNNNLTAFFDEKKVKINSKFYTGVPVLLNCEHLIAESGDVLFSSNQLKSTKLSEMPENFIVYATTSQLVNNTNEGLTGIKLRYKKDLPTNISAVKNYNIHKNDDNFLNYGNSNSKNLYLLLLEDL